MTAGLLGGCRGAVAPAGAGTPPIGSPFTFLAYGDNRAGGGCEGNAVHLRLIASMAADPGWDFVVNVGDMVTGYDSSTCFASPGACTTASAHGNFSQQIAPLRSRPPSGGLATSYIPVIGNHDDGSGWYPDPCGGRICDVFDLRALVDHPTPAGDPCGADYPSHAYFSFRRGNTLFLVLHVNSDYYDLFECNSPESPFASCSDYCRNAPRSSRRSDQCYNVHQYDWLKDQLAAAAGDPGIAHRIVFLHAPIYTSFEDHPPVAAAPALRELFDTYAVGMVLNGHNHTYERTVPIKAGVQHPGGTVYITTGGGGSPAYPPAGAWFTAAKSGAHHYVRLTVDGGSIGGSVIDVDGHVIDTF